MQALISPVYVADAFQDIDDVFSADRTFTYSKRKNLVIIPKEIDDMTLFDHLVEIEMDHSLFDFTAARYIQPKNLLSDIDMEHSLFESTPSVMSKQKSRTSNSGEYDDVPINSIEQFVHERDQLSVPLGYVSLNKRSPQSDPWKDILVACKALVSLCEASLEMKIRFASANFTSTFCTINTNPNTFRELFGKATNTNTVKLLQDSFLRDSTAAEYINLYRDDGVPLSCHVSLLPLTKIYSCGKMEKLAILTLRSASSVGNMAFSGIGGDSISRFSRAARLKALETF
jgi:hypothetical protein